MRATLVIVMLATVAAFGCVRDAGSMVSIPPPKGWEAGTLERRQERDRQFRSSSQSPILESERAAFAGLEYWAPDTDFYFAGALSFYPQPQQLELITTAGKKRPCEKIGFVSFTIDGQRHTLQVYRLLDQDPAISWDNLFLPFKDVTSGTETYPSGRYLDLVGARGGPYVLDFNAAYNPSCAYGAPERFACPVTPAENRLAIPIRAGERGYDAAAGG